MSFYSKGGSISRSTRTNRRDEESILGLSGWLFADLLLAIAVIFLVVQDRPGQKVEDAEVTKDNVANLKDQVFKLEDQVLKLEMTLAELGKTSPPTTSPPAKKSGLIANEKQQLLITIPNGAAAKSAQAFRVSLEQSKLIIDKKQTSFAKLKKANYKIGFVIWFTRDREISIKTSGDYLGDFVVALNQMGLILDSQFDAKKPGDFPCVCDYVKKALGNDLYLRVFLLEPTE